MSELNPEQIEAMASFEAKLAQHQHQQALEKEADKPWSRRNDPRFSVAVGQQTELTLYDEEGNPYSIQRELGLIYDRT